MKTGMGLVFIGIGGILAFAVKANTSVLDFNTAGYVLMIIGVLGLAIPRRGYGWVGQRLFVRRPRWRPVYRIAEAPHQAGVNRDPADARVQAGQLVPGALGSSEASSNLGVTADLPRQGVPGETEIVEDIYEK